MKLTQSFAILALALVIAPTSAAFQKQIPLFYCHHLTVPEAKDRISTFEFRNPQTNARGVACVIHTGPDSAYFYLEEADAEAGGHDTGSDNHTGALGFAARTADGLLTGHLWKFGSRVPGGSGSLPFTVDTGAGTDASFWTMHVSGRSAIWQPRSAQGVANWQMSPALAPLTCPPQMHELRLADPIAHSAPATSDRDGIVCVRANGPAAANNVAADFFAVGRRRAAGSGALRKFISFGRLQRPAAAREQRVLQGEAVSLSFFTAEDSSTSNAGALRKDQMKPDQSFRAIPSLSGRSVLLLDDLREKWIEPGMSEQEILQENYIL